MIEALERRTHLNGTIRVFTDEETIRIVGDRASNRLILEPPDDGDGRAPGLAIRTDGVSGTRLIIDGKNTSSFIVISETDGRPITIDLGEGEDELNIASEVMFGRTDISMGPG
ncbi:MAG TPA: hypothetical protein VF595_02345 [Tepidisphaeraceae bacterium]